MTKNAFKIYVYRDEDNVLKALISNSLSKNILLKFDDLDWIRSNPNHPNHEIKLVWSEGENILFINETIVDVYPRLSIIKWLIIGDLECKLLGCNCFWS
jgi:hypothetical protein